MGPKISFKNEFPCIENRHTLIASILFGCDSFNFEEAKPDGLSKDLENRKQYELGDGRVYEGQWIIGTSIREGKGRLLAADGTIYEGWFKQNKAHGRGRCITLDKAIYDGQW